MKHMDILDRELRKMAEQERWTAPDSLREKTEQMLAGLPEKQKEGKRRKAVGRKYLLLAAVLAALTGMTVGAAELFRWNERAEEAFHHPTEEEKDAMTLAGIAKEQNVSVSDQGITVTAVQTLMDTNTLYILLDVQSEEAVMNGTGYFTRTDEDGDGQSEEAFYAIGQPGDGLSTETGEDGWLFRNIGMSWTPQAPNDAPITPGNQGYLEIWAIKDEEKAWPGEGITISFNQYSYMTADENGKADQAMYVEGSWELQIPFSDDMRQLEKRYEPHYEIEIDGVPVELKAVELSPLSLKLVFDLDDKLALQEAKAPNGEDWCAYELQFAGFLDKEGNKIDCGFGGSIGGWDYETREAVEVIQFTRYVDLDEVGALLLGTEGMTEITEVPL